MTEETGRDIPATSCAIVVNEDMTIDLMFAQQEDMDAVAPDNALMVAALAYVLQHNKPAMVTAMDAIVKLGKQYEEGLEEPEADPS